MRYVWETQKSPAEKTFVRGYELQGMCHSYIIVGNVVATSARWETRVLRAYLDGWGQRPHVLWTEQCLTEPGVRRIHHSPERQLYLPSSQRATGAYGRPSFAITTAHIEKFYCFHIDRTDKNRSLRVEYLGFVHDWFNWFVRSAGNTT